MPNILLDRELGNERIIGYNIGIALHDMVFAHQVYLSASVHP